MLCLFVLFMLSLLKKWFDVKKKVTDKPRIACKHNLTFIYV